MKAPIAKNKRMRNYCCGLIVGISTCLLAQVGLAQSVVKVVFVSPQQLDAASLLPNPPASDSAQTTAELAELHQIQDTRSPAKIAHAKADDAEQDIFIFQDVLGKEFAPDLLPLTALLSDHVRGNEGVILNPAKKYFHRPRPYDFDPTLKPVCKTTTNPADYSFPSGHATAGYLEALVLTMILPEKRDAILARADDYAYSRLICGVHYQTDVVASKSVAYAMIGIIANDPIFRKEFEAAKAETRHALGF